jgi:hypothetical protein
VVVVREGDAIAERNDGGRVSNIGGAGRALGKSHHEFARARAAVSGQFRNTMKNLLVIRLNTQIWGFAGQASSQREFVDDQTDLQHVYLIGGAHQVWVPNLTPTPVTALAEVS